MSVVLHEKVPKWFDILTEEKIWFQFNLVDGQVNDFANSKYQDKQLLANKKIKKGDRVKLEVNPL